MFLQISISDLRLLWETVNLDTKLGNEEKRDANLKLPNMGLVNE